MVAFASCNKIACGDGYQDLESLLLSLFGVDENGCVGLKITWLYGVDCESLDSIEACGTVLTVEQAFKSAIVDDGCDGASLGVFFLNPSGPEAT